jgi:hypothetical protein
MVVAAILAAVSPGFQPGGLMWKRDHDVGLVLCPGAKMPLDTASKDACRYSSRVVFGYAACVCMD